MDTTSPLVIRTARPDDADPVTALLAELGYPDNNVDSVRVRLQTWADASHATVLLAQDGSRIIGVAAVAATPYLEREGNWGRIVTLVVAATCRGRGIGRRLVEAAENAARGYGCVAMEVTSARGRTDAHAFYRNLGYEDWCDRAGRFLKDLTPGVSAHSYAARFPATVAPPDG